MSRIHRNAALSAVALACAAGSTRADIPYWWYINNNNFGFEIKHMPDFDQRRSASGNTQGLPNNGSMYCVPTATVNLFAYAANHGFPNIGPGMANWQLQSKYNIATATINNVGFYMGTTPSGGTGGQGWDDGLATWLAGHPYMEYSHYWASGTWAPTMADMTLSVGQGGIVAFAYGRYQIASNWNGYPRVSTRTGGHAVTLTGTWKIGSDEHILYRDPADDSANATQSTFGNTMYNTLTRQVAFGQSSGQVRNCVELVTNSNDNLRRIIDEYVSIRPKFGMHFSPSQQVIGFVLPQAFFTNALIELPSEVHLDPSVDIIDAVLSPDNAEVFALVEDLLGNEHVQVVDPATGQMLNTWAFPRLEKITFGRKRQLYATDGPKTYCLDPDTGAIVASLNMNNDAMVYRDGTDQLCVLDGTSLKWYPENLALITAPPTWNIPTSVPIGANPKISIGPASGRVWLTTEASDALYGLLLPASGGPLQVLTISLPGIVNPGAVCEDAAGGLIVACDGSVKHVKQASTPVGSFWYIDTSSPWHNKPAGPMFCTSQSRTNFDPLLHTGPAWNNIDPSQLTFGEFMPDCPGDLDGSQRVDVNDLNQLLAGWGTASLSSDVNRNGITDVDDLNMLLANWNKSCVDLPCPGDADGNGVVNVDDLNLVLSNWLTADDVGDFNSDGVVNVDDLNDLLSHWQNTCL
ncbi:MAG: hypothetical protein R3B46_12710 [Phycisphaerales bacterium]|nr:hypothetical protein [Phycisphaerales bacterium]